MGASVELPIREEEGLFASWMFKFWGPLDAADDRRLRCENEEPSDEDDVETGVKVATVTTQRSTRRSGTAWCLYTGLMG